MRNRLMVFAGLCALVSTLLSAAPASATVWWLQYSDRATGLCLDTPYTTDSSAAEESTCVTPIGAGATRQQFQLVWLSNGRTQIVSLHSGKCLMDGWEAPDQGKTILLWTCDSSDIGQQWLVTTVRENPNGSEDLEFRGGRSGNCMTGGGAGWWPAMYTCDRSNRGQSWHQHLREGGGNH